MIGSRQDVAAKLLSTIQSIPRPDDAQGDLTPYIYRTASVSWLDKQDVTQTMSLTLTATRKGDDDEEPDDTE